MRSEEDRKYISLASTSTRTLDSSQFTNNKKKKIYTFKIYNMKVMMNSV